MNNPTDPGRDETAAEAAEIEARRAVVKRMLTLAATAPMAAMLFDPKSASASASGGGLED